MVLFFMVWILTNINLVILVGLSNFDFIHCQIFKLLKLSIKSRTQHQKLVFLAYLQDITLNMVPKNYTHAQLGIKLRFQTWLVKNSISCQVSCPCIALRSPRLSPLLLCSHLHRLYLLISHVYLNVHTLIVRACINYGVF